MTGVYLGIAYQIVPMDDHQGVWRWTYYPPIGNGESHSGEEAGESADAEGACKAAIEAFVSDAASVHSLRRLAFHS